VQAEKLKQLNPFNVDASLRAECLPGTRQDVLTHITEWLTMPLAGANILWLHGIAGAGKSTILTTVSQYFRSLHRLGALLFFDRNNPAGSSSSGVIRTIAYWLAAANAYIRVAVCDAITDDATLVAAPIQTQFRRLLLEPLIAAQSQIRGPIIIILDALDECGDPDSRESLVSLIINEFPKLPAVFRFLISSRPDSDIAGQFREQPHIIQMQLDITTDSTTQDIVVFLRQGMQNIRQTKRSIEQDWPGEQVIQTLASYSGGLFIWAATAYKFIRGFDPKKALATILGGGVANNLDELYAVALRNSADWGNETFAQDALSVLGTIVLSMEPLTDTTMDKLLGFEHGRSAEVLEYLGCVVQWGQGQPIRILHASFSDYLTDPKRSGRNVWCVDSQIQSKSLALGCLRVLNSQLRFNLCHLEDSNILNANVPDLASRIQQHIPAELRYATIFWAHHLRDTGPDKGILYELTELIHHRFLYWLEALSLIGQVALAKGSLETAVNCVEVGEISFRFLWGPSSSFYYIRLKPFAISFVMQSAFWRRFRLSLHKVHRISIFRPFHSHPDNPWSANCLNPPFREHYALPDQQEIAGPASSRFSGDIVVGLWELHSRQTANESCRDLLTRQCAFGIRRPAMALLGH
jgi:hypothetical protein